MKTIMILGANMSEVPLIKRSIEMGLKTVVVDRDKSSPGFELEGVVKEYYSIADKDVIYGLAKKHKIDGILSSVDAGVRPAAYTCQKLGLPGITEETAFWGTNKIAMRKKLKEFGVPVPEYYVASNKNDYNAAISNFSGKCVVKAADSSGSRGIYLLNDMSNLHEIEKAYDYCRGFSSTGELLIEECLDGSEICAETLSSNGECCVVQITDQMAKSPPFFTDCGYNQPSLLDEVTQNRIREIAVDANMALKNYQGSSCTEMIVTKDGPKVIELGLRLAADFMTTKMVPLSTGVDMPGDAIRIALGKNIDTIQKHNKACAVRYYMKERVGKIKDIIGIDRAKMLNGVVEVGTLKKVGDEAVPLRKSSDRLAYVIAQSDSVNDAIRIAEEAVDCIDFVVE